MNSNDKGKRFERQIANYLKERGYDARRGQQYCGAAGDADVIGLAGIHIEAKAVERLNLAQAYSQSARDARTGEVPIVVHKRNRGAMMVTLKFSDFLDIYEGGKAT